MIHPHSGASAPARSPSASAPGSSTAPGTGDREDFGWAAALRGPNAVVRRYAAGIEAVRPADALSDLVAPSSGAPDASSARPANRSSR